MSSADLAPLLVKEASVLLLPGTMFMPDEMAGGETQLRIAFANIDRAGVATLFERLSSLSL